MTETRELKISTHASLKAAGGTQSDEWNEHLTLALVNALPTNAAPYSKDYRTTAQTAALMGLVSSNIKDAIEAMLVTQMISANASSLELQRRAWLENQSFECRTRYLGLADKAARTVATLSEALNRHRGKGQSTVVVKHVTVNAEQAIVADHIHGGGGAAKSEEQPHAKPLAYAPQPEMPSALQAQRDRVPRTRRRRS